MSNRYHDITLLFNESKQRVVIASGQAMSTTGGLAVKHPTDINFLSEDDLNLKELSYEELTKAWEEWFELAQSTNDQDQDYFSHSCFGETIPEKKVG